MGQMPMLFKGSRMRPSASLRVTARVSGFSLPEAPWPGWSFAAFLFLHQQYSITRPPMTNSGMMAMAMIQAGKLLPSEGGGGGGGGSAPASRVRRTPSAPCAAAVGPSWGVSQG